MQCRDFENRLNAALDARRPVDADDELAAHLDDCRRCRADASAWAMVQDHLDWQPPLEPSVDFDDRVLADIRRERRRSAAILWSVAIAVAASVMVALTVRTWLPADEDGAPHVAAADAFPPETIPQGRAFPETAVVENQLPADNEDLAFSQTDAFSQVPDLLSDVLDVGEVEYLAMMRQTGEVMATLPHTVRQASQSPQAEKMAQRIRPVANSLSAAFSALRRTLPGQGDDSNS